MLRGLQFILFEKTNTPCNIGESYRCGIGNPYRAASIHHYQRVVHVRTCCVVYIISLAAYPMLLCRQLSQSSVAFSKSI